MGALNCYCPKCKETTFVGEKCRFCGGPLAYKLMDTSPSKVKYVPLKCQSKGITSLRDLAKRFSEDELREFTDLWLDNNKITSLDGIELFPNAIGLNFNGNQISDIEILPMRNYNSLSFANNKISNVPNKLLEIIHSIDGSEDVLGYQVVHVHFYGNPIQNLDWVQKIDRNIIAQNKIKIYLSPVNEFAKNAGFTETSNNGNGYLQASIPDKKGKCYIATTVMNDYDHPLVIDLREFRDNWILNKKWGGNFVNWYYKYGSIASNYIRESSVLKFISYYLLIKPLHLIVKLFGLHKSK